MNAILLSRYLDTNGDGTGTKNANGNYAGAVEEFYIEAQAGESLTLTSMLVAIEDTGGGTVQEYGNIGSALTNGIAVTVENEHGTVLMDLTDAVPVTTNAHWAQLCYDVNWLDKGSGNDMIAVRWTFAKSGQPIKLEEGQRLIVSVNDNLTGLVSHYFLVQGTY